MDSSDTSEDSDIELENEADGASADQLNAICDNSKLENFLASNRSVIKEAVTDVLNRLTNKSLDIENDCFLAANDLLMTLQLNQVLFEDLVSLIEAVLENSYATAINSKPRKGETQLTIAEKTFMKSRIQCQEEIQWQNILVASSCQPTLLGFVLQHIVQHVWTLFSFLSSKPDGQQMPSCVGKAQVDDDLADEAILKHAGWCFKRVREDIKNGPNLLEIRKSPHNLETVTVTKASLLSTISNLGSDVRAINGLYYFEANPDVLTFMKILHDKSSKLLKEQIKLSSDECILSCLKTLAVDASFREEWLSSLDKINGHMTPAIPKESSIILLQKICEMFVKSKQKRVIDQMGLRPNKLSKSLAQGIKSKQKQKTSEKPNCSMGSEELVEMREAIKSKENVEITAKKVSMSPNAKEIFLQLSGGELSSILGALKRPILKKKSKAKQVEAIIAIFASNANNIPQL